MTTIQVEKKILPALWCILTFSGYAYTVISLHEMDFNFYNVHCLLLEVFQYRCLDNTIRKGNNFRDLEIDKNDIIFISNNSSPQENSVEYCSSKQ